MASNPQWCRSLAAWKKFLSDWIADPASELGETGLKPLTFLDFRGVGGDFSLADQLWESLAAMLRDQKTFLCCLANLAVKNRPPIGFLKTVVIEKSGEHRDRLDLKVKGLAPIVGIVRLYALEGEIRESSTLARLEALKDRHSDVIEYGEEIAHAFEFIMLLRIQHQFMQISHGQAPDNVINPDTLTNLQKKTIKEAFNLISKLQNSISERYKPMKWQVACPTN
jgi:CBS domain-containing protein